MRTSRQEELGGASTHTAISGVADAAFDNDIDALLEPAPVLWLLCR